MKLAIRPAVEADYLSISAIVTTAFDRPYEARLIQTLRKAGDMFAESVAVNEEDGTLVGHASLVSLVLPEGWLALAPVSVSPERQGQGIGGELVVSCLDIARQDRAKAVIVVGDPAYYKRFGFAQAAASKLQIPFPMELTALYPIAPGTALSNERVLYPEAFKV